MSTLAVLGRADQGGLAAQTIELARHLKPEVVVVVDLLDAGRGPTDLSRYEHVDHVSYGPLLDGEGARLLATMDSVYVAEATYGTALAEAGVNVVLHANPELYRPGPDYASVVKVIAPTSWELDRLPPGTEVVPVPVASDRFTPRLREQARRFGFVAGPAMCDRNGRQLVIEALAHTEQVVEVLEPAVDYWDVIPPWVDVLVMPRRYGGLCLPAQEAAAQGIPVIMLDLPPQDGWPFVYPVPTDGSYDQQMKGGVFPVYSCNPRRLAQVIDEFAAHPTLVQAASARALRWADAHSWDRLLPMYERIFR